MNSHSSTRMSPGLSISEPVDAALRDGRPVVALESTIICHGMPWPANRQTALDVEAAVADAGAVPATIAILEGQLCVGLNAEQIRHLSKSGKAVQKVSRRDLPMVVAARQDGATTVAATMIIAAMAGIHVFATGGIGGVHRGVEETMDVSADLAELAQTNVAVVCAGVKSVLDIARTLEVLETHGVPVLGYGTDQLPAFYARSSGHNVDREVDNAATVARIMQSKWSLGLRGGLVVANPIPEAYAMPADHIDAIIDQAHDEMQSLGIRGKDTTPFLLTRIAEKTGGESLAANIALVLNNARVAAQIASEFAGLSAATLRNQE